MQKEPALEPIPRLALRIREAALAIGVSDRTLWDWADRGEVPYFVIGDCRLFPVDGLREWMARKAEEERTSPTPRRQRNPKSARNVAKNVLPSSK